MAHRFQSRHRKHLAANFTDEVAAQINGILHSIQTGESIKPNLQEQLEQTQQEKASQPEMLLSAKDLQIQEYDDALTARIIEKITVRSRNEILIRFIGRYEKVMMLIQ